MKRKLAFFTAAIIGLSTTAFTTVLPQEFNAFTEIDASALTIIAEIKELSLEKDTIEIGETTHLNVKFDTGTTYNAECYTSDKSVAKVVSGSEKNGWEIEGVGEGTAKITVNNGIYMKSVNITVTSGGTVEMVPYHITNGDTVEFYASEDDMFLVCCNEVKEFDFTVDEDTHNFTPKEDGMYVITRTEHIYDVVNISEYHVHCDYINYYNYTVDVKDSEISVKMDGTYSCYNEYYLQSYLDCDDEKTEICNKIGCQGEYSFHDADSSLISYWNGKMKSPIYYPSIEKHGAVLPCIAFKRVDENSITNEDRKLDFAFIECSSGTNGNFEFTTPDLLSVAIAMGSWDLFLQTETACFSITKNNETVNYAVDIDEDERIIQSSLRIVDDAIKGDVNADSKFTVADVVMLQKWLLAVPDVTLPNWKAADLCEDGELNVFDLCMMKRELISQMQFDDTPVLFIDDYMIIESPNGWKDEAYERVITLNGSRYSRPLCDCAFLSWEDHLNHIKSGEKTEYITDSAVLQKISDFSKNASKYENCEVKYYRDWGVEDYGQTDISVLYVDGKGNTQELTLYGYGEECYCLDDPEAIELIKLLIEKEYIPGRDFLSYMLSDSKSQITMGDVIELAEKGSDMRLADLEGFECVDIGAGNHTFLYDTADGRFRLSIGSANGKDIGYAKLECFESGEIIDISKESVEEFYNKNTFIAEKDIVMPDVEVEYGMPFGIRGGDSGLYAAPSTDAPVSAYIPKWNMLHEIGYQEGNNDWIFTEYNGIKGWVRVKDDKGNSNLEYMAAPAKPVIYLYPEQETDVHVELDLKNATLSTTYPKYKNGWDVTAMPDGTLINKADGTKHSYLFWDACNDSTRYDFSKGFCVAGEDTEAFLKEKLTYMGLNEQEMNEFIVYWLPLMEHNAYNLISFQTDAYTDNAKLNITPNPDSLLRIFMTYIPLDEAVEIAPQQLETFERRGFTVVEWGGTKIG